MQSMAISQQAPGRESPLVGSAPSVRSMTARQRQRGVSLIEMMIVMAISTAVILMVLGIIEEAMRTTAFIESHNNLTIWTQKPMNAVQREILQARQILGEDAVGTSYRTNIEVQLPASSKDVPVSLLPIVNGAGALTPDTGGVRYTGNCLLLVRQLDPFPIALAADGTDPTNFPAVTFMADRYQIEYFYLTRNTKRPFRGGTYALDLIRFRSIVYADYFQLANATGTLSATQKTSLATKIKAAAPGGPALSIAWDPTPGQVITSAFYAIDANLAFPAGSTSPYATPVIAMLDNVSLLPEIFKGSISGRMDYTVAFRTGTPPGSTLANVPPLLSVPQYFEKTATMPIDCGFEVKVVGPVGFRQVLTRLVLYSNYGVNRYDVQEGFVITSSTK
jgi:prepilin-type N-terminal cleavage/methylation domain-containing protein